MPLIDVAPESLESLLDPDFLCSKNSTSRSSSPAASQDIATAQGDEEDETELPSLRSLLGLDSTRPYSEDAPNQKSLSESTLRLWGWAEVPGPNGLPVLQELSDHESEAPAPLTSDARQARGITAFALENQSVLTSGNNSTSERLHHGHKLTDKLKAADSEWALRGYPRISWRTLDARLQKFSPALRGILNGATPSFYRSELESAVARRADPKFRCMENAKAGYYGPRGQQVMEQYIIFEFGSYFPRRAVEDHLLHQVGVADYVVTVLVPELAVMLIKEDMKVCDDKGRQILQESAHLGETLHEDV